MKHSIVLLLLCVLLLSCSTRSVRQEFAGSRDIYVGWLDLGPDYFRSFGYLTRAEWEKDIADLNRGFQVYMGDYLKEFKVSGARNSSDKPPVTGFVILLSNVVIDPQTSIVADVTIIDAAAGNVVKQFSAYGTSFHMSYSMYAFAGRLNNACYALAYEIYIRMTEEKK
jgi:hypothetical protein